jgi:hypothetical protein
LRMEDPEYRVFVRIPVPRPMGFIDPPSFIWNAEKERMLWKVISRARRGDINCTSPIITITMMACYCCPGIDDRAGVGGEVGSGRAFPDAASSYPL